MLLRTGIPMAHCTRSSLWFWSALINDRVEIAGEFGMLIQRMFSYLTEGVVLDLHRFQLFTAFFKCFL
jgi:hypothetical protein